MAKKVKRSTLVKKLDKAFSDFTRSKDSVQGMSTCFTCGKVAEWKTMDAGHFQSRGKYSTRWEERNVKPQCKGCNMVNGGQQYVFGKRLDALYGPGSADEVVFQSNQLRKFSSQELIELTEYYRGKMR